LGEARQKGVGIVNARAYVLERYGADGWQAVLAQLPHADRQGVDTAIGVGWYTHGVYMRLVRAIDEVHGVGDLAMAVQLGRWGAERDLSTIYRLFFRFANPAWVVEKSTEYWRRFHEDGEWIIERVGKMHVVGTLRGWRTDDAAYCRVNGGYMGRLLELVGARGVTVDHASCVARGDRECVFRVRWGDEVTDRDGAPREAPRSPVSRPGAAPAPSAAHARAKQDTGQTREAERVPAHSGKVPTAARDVSTDGARAAIEASLDALASSDKRRPR